MKKLHRNGKILNFPKDIKISRYLRMPIWHLNPPSSSRQSSKKVKKRKSKKKYSCRKDELAEGVANCDLYELRSLRRIVRDSRSESYRHKSSSRMSSQRKKKTADTNRSSYNLTKSTSGISLQSHLNKSNQNEKSRDDAESLGSSSHESHHASENQTSGYKNTTSFVSELDDEEDSLDIRSHCDYH